MRKSKVTLRIYLLGVYHDPDTGETGTFMVVKSVRNQMGEAVETTGSIIDADLIAGSLPVICEKCGMPHILEGDIEPVASEDRPMGTETTYCLSLYGKCPACGAEMEARVIIWEYPPGEINAIDLEENINCRYNDIGGLEHMINEIIRYIG